MGYIKDQFWHGRIPIRPLAYKNKNVAYTNEFIIDYGADGNYHMYITDSNDPETLIDLTTKIADMVSSDGLKIDDAIMDLGVEDMSPMPLKQLLKIMVLLMLRCSDNTGFLYERDFDSMLAPSTVSALLKDGSEKIILPVTFAENVFYKDGSTLQENHSNLTKFAITSQDITVTDNNIMTYQFNYPFEDYGDYFEVRVDGRVISKNDYSVKNFMNGEHFSAGAITFIANPKFSTEHNSVISIVFMYNALAYKDTSKKYMDGKNISMNSIPSNRLEKVSDSYELDDPTCLASSKALSNLSKELFNTLEVNSENSAYYYDIGDANKIEFRSNKTYPLIKPIFMCNVLLASSKSFNATVTVRNGYLDKIENIPIVDASGKPITRGFPRGKILKLLWVKEDNNFKVLTTDISQLRNTKLIRKCVESEEVIEFDTLAYPIGGYFTVYRNGIRLFEDIDYSIDYKEQQVHLFNRTEEGEVIVIEVLYL